MDSYRDEIDTVQTVAFDAVLRYADVNMANRRFYGDDDILGPNDGMVMNPVEVDDRIEYTPEGSVYAIEGGKRLVYDPNHPKEDDEPLEALAGMIDAGHTSPLTSRYAIAGRIISDTSRRVKDLYIGLE